MEHKPWTEPEIEILRQQATKLPMKELSKLLPHRSPSAIRQTCLRHNIPRKIRLRPPWTPEEDLRIKRFEQFHLKKDAHLFPGRSKSALKARCRKFLVPIINDRHWTMKETDILSQRARTHTARMLLEHLPGRNLEAIQAKCRAEGFRLNAINSWSEEQEARLIRIGHNHTSTELGVIFDKSRDAIRAKAKKINLTIKVEQNSTRWSKAEKTLLQTLARKGLNRKEISDQMPGRTSRAINAQARKYKITLKDCPLPGGRAWTATESAYLLLHYRKKPTRDIAEHLQRSYHAVTHQAQFLGVAKKTGQKTRWSDSDLAYLKKFAGAKTVKLMATHLDRSCGAVRHKLLGIGLSRKLNLWTWAKFRLVINVGKRHITKDDFRRWQDMGLKTRKQLGQQFNNKAVRRFLRIRPEALDIYDLCEETLDELDINLDTWPEPPAFKIIVCEGCDTRRHPLVINCLDLHAVNPACVVCGTRLKRWAHGYAEEWIEPARSKVKWKRPTKHLPSV